MESDNPWKTGTEWENTTFGHLETLKENLTEWKREDVAEFKYRTFAKLVLDLGGWSDPTAVEGATTGTPQCLSIG